MIIYHYYNYYYSSVLPTYFSNILYIKTAEGYTICDISTLQNVNEIII